jgi:hypothetical protein
MQHEQCDRMAINQNVNNDDAHSVVNKGNPLLDAREV